MNDEYDSFSTVVSGGAVDDYDSFSSVVAQPQPSEYDSFSSVVATHPTDGFGAISSPQTADQQLNAPDFSGKRLLSDASILWDQANTPNMGAGPLIPQPQGDDAWSGVARGGINLAEGFTSPLSLATLGVGAATKTGMALTAAALPVIKSIPDRLIEAYHAKTPGDRWQALTEAGGGALALGGGLAARGKTTPSQVERSSASLPSGDYPSGVGIPGQTKRATAQPSGVKSPPATPEDIAGLAAAMREKGIPVKEARAKTPAEKVYDEINAFVEPIEGLVIEADTRGRGNTVTLDNIEVDKKLQGKGIGSAALQKLTEIADKHGVALDLEAVDVAGIDTAGWYGRHGFVKTSGNQMVRKAQEPKAVVITPEAELAALWPGLSEREMGAALSGPFSKGLRAKYDALTPEQKQAVDGWFEKNDSKLGDLAEDKAVAGRMDSLRLHAEEGDVAGFASAMNEAISDLTSNKSPGVRGATTQQLFEQAGAIASGAGLDVQAVKSAVMADLRKKYGADAEEMAGHIFGSIKPKPETPATPAPIGPPKPTGNVDTAFARKAVVEEPKIGARELVEAKAGNVLTDANTPAQPKAVVTPELMSPMEWATEALTETKRRKEEGRYGAKPTPQERNKMDALTVEQFRENMAKIGDVDLGQKLFIEAAIDRMEPVSVAASDAYGIKPPKGYAREGDRYVFKSATPKPATPTTPEPQPAPRPIESRPVVEPVVAKVEPVVEQVKPKQFPPGTAPDPEVARLLADEKAKTEAQQMKLGGQEAGFTTLPADIAQAVSTHAKAIYKKGMEFAQWAGEMISKFGDTIKGHLHDLWQSVSGQVILKPARESGAIFGIGARKPKANTGPTPRGDTEHLVIPSAIKRLGHGLANEGAADILRRSKNKVGQMLGKATNRHVDMAEELKGKYSARLEKATEGLKDKEVEAAYAEASAFVREQENGRPVAPLSPPAQKVMDAWGDIADETGDLSQSLGIKVEDNGKFRPIGKIGRSYIPRMLSDEVQAAMRDPDSNGPLWDSLVTAVQTHYGMAPDEAREFITKKSERLSSNDFMANVEMARGEQLPEIFYEYDLRKLAADYIPGYAERVAQIIAYGQRLENGKKVVQPDLWDIAQGEAKGTPTKDWLTEAEGYAKGVKLKGGWAKLMPRLQTAASAGLLSNPTSTVPRNFLTGIASTAELLGFRRAFTELAKSAVSARNKMSAREIGSLQQSLNDALVLDQLDPSSKFDSGLRKVSDTTLKWSGFTGSESFVRGHATGTALHYIKDWLNYKPGTKLHDEGLALFKRMDADPAKIAAEKGDWKNGPATREFIRRMTRETQGGYRFNQVPMWAMTPAGRFFYQYGRWGTQRSRSIYKNAIAPAFKGTDIGGGKVVRDFKPLSRMLLTTVVLGETFGAISGGLFSRDRKDASFEEIGNAEDLSEGMSLLAERLINDVIMAGTLGIWGQPVDWATALKTQSRFKNPADPPGLVGAKAVVGLLQDAYDQNGNITYKDIKSAARSLAPGTLGVYDVARNALDAPGYEAENKVRTYRQAVARWDKAMGHEAKPKGGDNYRKSPRSPLYEELQAELLQGNSAEARKLANDYIAKQPPNKRVETRRAINSSMRGKQPFRSSVGNSADDRREFLKWAREHLPEDQMDRIDEVEKEYRDAGVRARFFTR